MNLTNSLKKKQEEIYKLSLLRVEQIKDRIKEGKCGKEIAKELKISRTRLYQIMQKNNIPKFRRITPVDEIVLLHRNGLEVADIAFKLSLSLTTIRKVLNRNGVKLKKGGRRKWK